MTDQNQNVENCPNSRDGKHFFDLLANYTFKADFFCKYCLTTVTIDYTQLKNQEDR